MGVDTGPEPLRTILLAYDGSEGSRKAVEYAEKLASPETAQIIVVVAFPAYPRVTSPSKADAREIREAREAAEQLVEVLRGRGFNAQADVLEGPAADAIIRAGDAHEADVIVVGSRGFGHFTGLLLGSVSDRVVHYSTRPVLVAR